jgi:hypothetical protein
MQADPHQVQNLAKSPRTEHQQVLEKLRGVLTTWIEETNDQGRVPEPPDVVANQGFTKPQPPKGKGKKGKKK